MNLATLLAAFNRQRLRDQVRIGSDDDDAAITARQNIFPDKSRRHELELLLADLHAGRDGLKTSHDDLTKETEK